MTHTKHVSLGPVAVEMYPIQAFSKMPANIKTEDVWKLCGPTVEMNLGRHPLWKVFAIVYLEGLLHGSETQAARGTAPAGVPELHDAEEMRNFGMA